MSGGSQGVQTGQDQQTFAYGGVASPNPPVLSGNLPATQNMGGPDAGVGYVPTDIGFDNSGSDGGVGGQPVNQMQTPLQMPVTAPPPPPPPPAPPAPPVSAAPVAPNPQQFGNKPLSLSQFRPPQGGLQIQGNPTSSLVQRPQQR